MDENKTTTTPDGLGKCNVMQMPSMKHILGTRPLTFLGGKMYRTSFGDRKGRSGQLQEHLYALEFNKHYAGFVDTDGKPLD